MINIRIKTAERDLIDQTAALRGKSRSDFTLEASRRAAEEALLDRTFLRVDRRPMRVLSRCSTRRRGRMSSSAG